MEPASNYQKKNLITELERFYKEKQEVQEKTSPSSQKNKESPKKNEKKTPKKKENTPEKNVNEKIDLNNNIEAPLKVKSIPFPLEKSITIHDIGLKMKGFCEDEYYMNNPEVLKYVRRGNTIVELADRSKHIVRKGLEKFFDLDYSFIEFHLKKGEILEKKRNCREIIFAGIEGALKNGNKVRIYQTEKANGENCQISYFRPIDSWLVSSKNVSILAKSRTDVEFYEILMLELNEQEKKNENQPKKNEKKNEETKNNEEKNKIKDAYKKNNKFAEPKIKKQPKEEGLEVSEFIKKEKEDSEKKIKKNNDRFAFAKLILNEWFNLLDKISDIETLKKDLENKTLVGEYCGNQEFQHLIKYNEISIYFYALVDNDKDCDDSCFPPQKVFDFCKKHNLRHVKFHDFGSFDDFIALNMKLHGIFEKVSIATINEMGEGCVLYFLKEKKNENEQDHILSLCKVKTLEYRIFRKLREKLKRFDPSKKEKEENKAPSTEKQIAPVTSKFKNEVNDLCKNFKPPLKIEDYVEFAEYCFIFAKQPGNYDHVKKAYIDFLTIALYYFYEEYKKNNEKRLNIDYFKSENMQKIKEMKWTPYKN